MPTLLNAANISEPQGMDGRTFLPVLKGHSQEGRDQVFTQFHQTAAKQNYPMRCVQNNHFGYIFNPWSNGERKFINESQSGRTMNAMREAAKNDAQIQERVDFFLYRVPEELYDLQNDPDCRYNLIDDPNYADVLMQLRTQLEEWMVQTQYPALDAFRHRYEAELQEQLVINMGQLNSR